jgi:hypothetical protein
MHNLPAATKTYVSGLTGSDPDCDLFHGCDILLAKAKIAGPERLWCQELIIRSDRREFGGHRSRQLELHNRKGPRQDGPRLSEAHKPNPLQRY